MKKLQIDFAQPQIEINGCVFDLKKSDGDILEDAIYIEERYKTLDVKDAKAVVSAFREVKGYVDAILGEGALAKISAGKPISLIDAVKAMAMIAEAATDSYSEYISKNYG